MSKYKYKSIDPRGRIFTGYLHANNVLELEARITAQSQDLIRYEEIKTKGSKFGNKQLSRKDIINLVFQLEQLTKAGVPLLDAVHDLRDTAMEGYYHDVLAAVAESISSGKTFSEALSEFDNDFDTVFISLIKVGEETGELPKILKDMGNTLRWIDELVSATKKVMIYPTVVAFVVFCVTAFLMVYLVPQIIPFVEEMGGEIPTHTKALIAVSGFFSNHWYFFLIIPVTIILIIKIGCKKSEAFRFKYDHLKLNFPIVGNILYKIKLARLANYLSLLYSSGITVLRSLEICKPLMDSPILELAVQDVRQYINDGKGISDSFQSVGVFPPLVIRMIRIGENTGNIDESLLNVTYFFNREIEESVEKIEPAVTPILTVIMGGLLGWIMISVLGPVWDTIGNLG